jgi:integrase
MSVYLDRTGKVKTWRYDFLQEGKRYSAAGFKTKQEARQAEARRREAIEEDKEKESLTDMVFLDLLNLRLDHVKAYNSTSHYEAYRYLAIRWARDWGEIMCGEMNQRMIQAYLLQRRKVSAFTANKDLRYLRSTFNFGLKKGYIRKNPTAGIEYFPVNKAKKYVPPQEDIERVLAEASQDARDYLIALFETLARVGEINALTWDDVSFEKRSVTLYTRKKRGGHRTPRTIFMTDRLFEVLSRKNAMRDREKPWVFWKRAWSRKAGRFIEGPFAYRRDLLKDLCVKAGVRPFTYHALRHAGASILDSLNVPMGSIQRILGHENRTTTEIYLHSIGQSEREAMMAFERATRVPRESHGALEMRKGAMLQ